MKPYERDELLIQMRVALLGIPDTEEKGIAGDIKEIETHLKTLNKSVGKNTSFRKTVSRLGIPLLIALILGILKSFGVI